MKTYKEVKTLINEAGEGSDTPNGGAYAPADFAGNIANAMYQFEKPGVIEQINGYLKALSEKEYIEPRGAIVELRTRLNIINLDFEIQEGVVVEGKYEYKLTANGGRFGWDMEVGDVVSDDGISHRLGHGLKITCESIQGENGLWQLHCEVVAST
jgi:hypothetical protein